MRLHIIMVKCVMKIISKWKIELIQQIALIF